MSTIILNNLIENSNIDFSSLKVGNQFIQIYDNAMYDMHESYILNDIKHDFIYSFKSIKLIYNVNREAESEIKYKDYINIFDTIIKVHESDISCNYKNKDLYNYIVKSNFESIKTNDIITMRLSPEEYVYFCRILLENKYLILAYHIDFKEEFIKKELLSGIFDSKNDKCVTFDIDDPDEFIEKISSISSEPAIMEFKTEIYDVCKYDINDYLNGKDKQQLNNLFDKAIDKYFNPKFRHEKFAVYLDYTGKSKNVINTYDGKIITFMGPEYKRISDSINKYYYEGDIINPLTGYMQDGKIIHDDASGIIYEKNCVEPCHRNDITFYRTKIYGVLVECISNEKQELIDRMKIVETLTNTP